MRRKSYIRPILGFFAVTAACSTKTPAPSSFVDAGISPPAADAGPPPLPVTSFTALWDGGTSDLELPDASLPPWAQLDLRTVPLSDLRVRILDDAGRMEPNRTRITVGDGGLDILVVPTRPLPATKCCRYVLDGEHAALPMGPDEQAFQPFVASLSIGPPPPRPQAPSRRHRRHRRRR